MVERGWRDSVSDAVDRAVCEYAEKLTRTPWAMGREDVQALRDVGLNDAAIHDLIQVAAYFNYINRVADAVHVECEPDMPAYPAHHGAADGR